MLRNIFGWFFLSMLVACSSEPTSFPPENNEQQLKVDREALTQLKEVDWPKAYREQDTVLLDKILADEFQMVDNSGTWYNKQDELDYIKKHKPSYESFNFEIKRLEIFENGTAIVAGTGHIFNKDASGKLTEAIYQSSNILIKRNGVWKAVASHVSGYQELASGEG